MNDKIVKKSGCVNLYKKSGVFTNDVIFPKNTNLKYKLSQEIYKPDFLHVKSPDFFLECPYT